VASWNKDGLVGWRRGFVHWKANKTLYLSIPFTWHLEDARQMALKHNGPVVAGGPAVKLVGIDWADTPDECPYDTLAMHNPLATFTTRGCPNGCGFCAVPKIEGKFRQLDTWKPAPIVCDNNLLAATKSHIRKVVKSLRPFECVDFNQGLDAHLFRRFHAEEFAKLKNPMIRFAFDSVNDEGSVARAIKIAREAGLRNFHVYVLIGFGDTPEDALYRLEKVREWGIRPNPMRFQPLDAVERNAYVGRHWSQGMLNDVVRYYSKLRWLEHIPFEEYHRSGDMPLLNMQNDLDET
jgi:hypothetical protein